MFGRQDYRDMQDKAYVWKTSLEVHLLIVLLHLIFAIMGTLLRVFVCILNILIH